MGRPIVIAGAVLAAVAAAPPAFSATVRPFGTVVEAESYDAGSGARIYADPAASGGHAVAFSPGDRVRLDAVDFATYTQASGFATWRACSTGPGTVDLRLDSPTATPFLTFQIVGASCAQWGVSSQRLGTATTPAGVHDLYLSASGTNRCEFYRLDSFQLIKQTTIPIP
jgi:hypothetical protein